MELFKAVVGPRASTSSPIVILHGLFGSHRNWQSISRALSERLGRLVISVDLRNHGKSVLFAEDGEPRGMPMTWSHLSNDLHLLLREINRPVTLMGHSLGGSVSMQYALRDPRAHLPTRQLDKMIIVDIAPHQYDFAKSAQYRYIVAMRELHQRGLPRHEAIQIFKSSTEPDEQIVQFLFTNYGRLPGDGGRFGFLLPLQALQDEITTLGQTFMERIRHLKSDTPTFFLKGGKSDYIDEAGERNIAQHFSTHKIVSMPESGHWPHYDNPVLFLDLIIAFINSPHL